jgi:hypothetical protein
MLETFAGFILKLFFFPYLLLVLYGGYLKFIEWRKIRSLRKHASGNGVTTGVLSNRISAEKEKTRDKLFGLLYSDVVLYGSNAILAMAAITSFSQVQSQSLAAAIQHRDTIIQYEKLQKDSDEQFKKLNRPYISIQDLKVDAGTLTPTSIPGISTDQPGFLTSAVIENYGKLPAYFDISIRGWVGNVKPFQATTGYIMSNQSLPMKWIMYADNSKGAYRGCNFLESSSINIKYGLSSKVLEFTTIVKRKNIDSPLPLDQMDNKEFVIHIYCKGEGQKIPVWSIESD